MIVWGDIAESEIRLKEDWNSIVPICDFTNVLKIHFCVVSRLRYSYHSTHFLFLTFSDLNDINTTNGQKRNKADLKTLTNIRRYLITNKAYGKSGHRDDVLEMSGIYVGGRQGTLHFIRFPTSQVFMSIMYYHYCKSLFRDQHFLFFHFFFRCMHL